MCQVQVAEPAGCAGTVPLAGAPGNCGPAGFVVRLTSWPLLIAVRSMLVIVVKSYVGLAVGWSLSGIQSSVPIGSVVTKPPSLTGVLERNQPSVVVSPSECTPGRP